MGGLCDGFDKDESNAQRGRRASGAACKECGEQCVQEVKSQCWLSIMAMKLERVVLWAGTGPTIRLACGRSQPQSTNRAWWNKGADSMHASPENSATGRERGISLSSWHLVEFSSAVGCIFVSFRRSWPYFATQNKGITSSIFGMVRHPITQGS